VVDGELGRGTRAAIRVYQEENGLEVTGQIDRPLLRALGLL
jgi:peptidoglycan hydrolase-like protein with peptidoglycan-binding domain